MNLAFYDHHRQSYSHLPLRDRFVAEFMVGNYPDDDEGGVATGGEFMIGLHDFNRSYRQSGLTPQLCVFGDGLGSARILLALADAHEVPLLDEVPDRDAFSRRLLSLGLRDASDKPLEIVISR